MATLNFYATNNDDVIMVFGYHNRFILRVVLEYCLHDWMRRSHNPCDIDGLRLITAIEHKAPTQSTMRTPCKPCKILIQPFARRIFPLKGRHVSSVIQQTNTRHRTYT